MHNLNVLIKLVLFGVVSDSLVVFLRDGSLPAQTLTPEIPLNKQVNDLLFITLGRSVGDNYLEQLYTFSKNAKGITLVYFILLPLKATEFSNNGWIDARKKEKPTADHEIITYAIQRLQWKIEYTNVVYSLLPNEFTLSELQQIYEAILGHILDKRNFRKKILSLDFLERTGKKHKGISRPALMYSFKKRSPSMIKVFS